MNSDGTPPIDVLYEAISPFLTPNQRELVDPAFGIFGGLTSAIAKTAGDVKDLGDTALTGPGYFYDYVLYQLTHDNRYLVKANATTLVMSNISEAITSPVRTAELFGDQSRGFDGTGDSDPLGGGWQVSFIEMRPQQSSLMNLILLHFTILTIRNYMTLMER